MRITSFLLALLIFVLPSASGPAALASDCCCDECPPQIWVADDFCPGECYSGELCFEAWAWDDCCLASFQVWLDGEVVAEGDCGGYICFCLDTAELGNASHVISIVATDASGNMAADCYQIEPGDCPDGTGVVVSPTVCNIKGGECDLLGYVYMRQLEGPDLGMADVDVALIVVTPQGDVPYLAALTDANGMYRFTGIPCGYSYRIVAKKDSMVFDPPAAVPDSAALGSANISVEDIFGKKAP